MLASLVDRWGARRLGAAAVAVLGVAVFVAVFFQPHKLFIDERVDEAAPTADGTGVDLADRALVTAKSAPAVQAGEPPPGGPPDPAPKQPSGEFRSLEHATTGRAVVTELTDGTLVLRLEEFRTSNGPDLRVYLSAGSSDAAFGKEYGEDFVELGRLKGNIGNQNYEIPAGTDLARYRNAVIWCARFSVGFGVATLS